ncbi:DUF1273 domain-containing protein [Furfurilactobacillus milii]|uniref:UPF0398 protein GB992_04155 n=1 Tax=Furfurilactobacillus rossiae TaxID=231049 RepID=A0A7C9N5Z6_9LACO|nr:DUF1273 domain-containing protein [Furfurilactobacillus milii]MYV05072.1 DUF1273 family protein [Furfurilactobacillus milii]
MSRLWVTGYRSYELGVFGSKDPKLTVLKYALRQTLTNQIENGVDWIITGGQLGVEQWTIEVANDLKADYPQLKVAMMLPFAEFGQNWNENNQAQLATLRERVDFSDSVSKQSYQSPQQLKNYQAFMLSHTDAALLVYDVEHEGKPTYDYLAIKAFNDQHPYEMTLIDFDWLQESADEYQENHRQSF